jgi:hypothetical protein
METYKIISFNPRPFLVKESLASTCLHVTNWLGNACLVVYASGHNHEVLKLFHYVQDYIKTFGAEESSLILVHRKINPSTKDIYFPCGSSPNPITICYAFVLFYLRDISSSNQLKAP